MICTSEALWSSLIWDNAKVPWLKSTAWTLLCAPYCQSSALSEFMAALDLVTLPACFSIYPFYARVMDCDFHNSFTQTHSPHQTELEHWGTRASRLMGPGCPLVHTSRIWTALLWNYVHKGTLIYIWAVRLFIQCGQAWILIYAAAFNTYWYCTLGHL